MKIRAKLVRSILAAVASAVAIGASHAGVPLNGLQGSGGIAFNPLAYTAGQNRDPQQKETPLLSKPQFGAWYVSLGDVDVDWTAIGVAETFLGRLELSYGYEVIAPTGGNIKKENFGAKVNLIPENAGGHAFVPAVSVGGLFKTTDNVATNVDDRGVDAYLVATKLITQLPRPVLISAGLLSSTEQVSGVFGYNDDRDLTFFGNIDVLPVSTVAVGFEYKQGSSFDTFKNADYWDAHVAWFATANLTLVAAYVNAGDETSTSEVGLGDGLVLSTQYAF